MNKTLVLYHGNCYDGFGAAWCAWSKFEDEADYKAVNYGDKFPEEIYNYDTVYILDFSFPRAKLLEIADKVNKVVLLDHHKTAEEDLRDLVHPNLEIVFDMNRSGTGITSDYFFRDRSKFINCIEDRDLWRFKYPETKFIHAALVSYPFDFNVWSYLSKNTPKLAAEGEILIRMEDSLVAKICSKSWIRDLAGYKVPTVNTTAHWSEVGHYLLDKYPEAPFASCFTEFEDNFMWSLRSNGDFDVSTIAKQFGGGGHKNAAGFRIKKEVVK